MCTNQTNKNLHYSDLLKKVDLIIHTVHIQFTQNLLYGKDLSVKELHITLLLKNSKKWSHGYTTYQANMKSLFKSYDMKLNFIAGLQRKLD